MVIIMIGVSNQYMSNTDTNVLSIFILKEAVAVAFRLKH